MFDCVSQDVSQEKLNLNFLFDRCLGKSLLPSGHRQTTIVLSNNKRNTIIEDLAHSNESQKKIDLQVVTAHSTRAGCQLD